MTNSKTQPLSEAPLPSSQSMEERRVQWPGGFKTLRLISALVSLFSIASCSALGLSTGSELDDLLSMLAGTYIGEAPDPRSRDGNRQIIVHKFVSIDARRFGQQVFYYQLSRTTADGPLLQQKIFVFQEAEQPGSIRMRAYVFSPGQEPGNLHRDKARIDRIEPGDLLSFPEACDFVWTSVDNGFEAVVRASNCRFASRGFGQEIRPEMIYRVAGDQFYWTETLYGADGKVLASTQGTLVAVRQ